MKSLWVFAIFTLSLGGCFKTASQLESEQAVSELRKDKASLNADLEQLRQDQAKLGGRIEELEAASNGRSEGLKKDQTTITSRLQALEEKNTNLTTEIAKLTAELETLKEQSQASREHSSRPEKEHVTATPKNLAETLTKVSGLVKDKQYDEALKLIEPALNNKKIIKGRDQLLYWQGEALFQKKDYKRGILSFTEIVDNHPKSNRYNMSVKRIVASFNGLGMKKEAHDFEKMLKD